MSKAPSAKATPARAAKPAAAAPAKAPLRSGMLSNTRLNDKSGKIKPSLGRR